MGEKQNWDTEMNYADMKNGTVRSLSGILLKKQSNNSRYATDKKTLFSTSNLSSFLFKAL